MTEPREPETEDPGPDQPHGLAEEIRQEIEEVVEHVPKPLRWTVGKLVRLAILSVVGIVVVLVVTAVLYVANRTEWAAQELALLINQTLASRTDVVLEIADIKGNPFTGVRVLRPRVRFRSGEEPSLLEAPEMRLRYSAWALATGRQRSVVLEIDRPMIRLARGPDGKLRLPIWKPGPPRGRARELDVILRLRNGAVITPDTVGRIDGFDLEALAHVGHPTRVDVRSLRWAHGPFGSVLDRGAFTYAGGDSAHLDLKEVRTRDVALRGRAAWASGGPEAIVHLEVARVRWRWLSRVLHRDDFDVPGEGHAVVDARGGQALTGRFSAGGVWDSLAADAQGGFHWRDHRLRVEPLMAHSRAGDLNGVVLWAQSGWEIAARVRGGDPSRWSMIGIRHWPAGNLNGRFRYAVDTRAAKHARLSAWLGASEWTGWRADSGIVRVDFTPVGPDSFTVLAERRGGEMRLRALTDDTGWGGEYVLTRYRLDEWAEGRASGIRGTLASGRGTAESHSGNLRVTGSLDGVLTDWLGLHTARWRMSGMSGALLPAPDLTADVRLEDFTFLTVHWDSLSVRLHVGDGTVALPGLAAFAGDTVLAMTARADWDPRGWRLTADSAEVRSDQFHWTAEPPMRFAGDSHGVDFDRLVAHDGDAQLGIEGRWAGPGGAYDWSARAEHLDLGRLGLPREWELGGRADGQLRITGVSGDPQWELRARSWMPGSRGHRADSIQVVIGGGPSRLVVREALARLGDGTVSAAGEVTGMARAWPDTLTGPGVLHWVSDASRWTGLIRADGLVLDRLQKLVPAARGWTGRASGTLELGGRPGSPDLTWNAEAQPLGWADYRLDRAVAHGRCRDGRLEVPELRMIRRGVVSTVTGSMPLRIAVGRRPQVDEAPMEWRVDLPDGDLALLPYFVPQIGSAAGKFELSARLTGTASHPELTGTARVREGHGVRLAGREEVLDGVNAVFTLDESRITLDTLTARQRKRQGSPGYVTAQGVVNLRGLALKDYRFKLDLRDFTAVESGVYGALLDGRFIVTNGPRRGGVTLPLVEGNVELRRAVMLFDFANQSQVEMVAAATKPLYWVYRIQLSANDNLRWKPPQADIEFSADLRLEQTPDSLIIYGDMAGLRGSYYYLSNKFTMDRVNLTFDNVGGVNPKLDILATTRVPKNAVRPLPGATLAPAERGNVNVTVTITGRAAEPVMTFAADDPQWDQSTILAALTYGQVGGREREAAADFADTWVTRNLNRQLSEELSTIFQGYLEDWTLERESGGLFQGTGDYVIGTNVPLSRDINLRVRQSLGIREPGTTSSTSTSTTTNPFERDVEAEYRISRFFYITSQLTQRRPLSTTSGTATTPPEFNVNLKARWEY